MNNQSVAQRLHEQLSRIIAATAPGERLPSEPLLAEQLGVSRATLREAMRAFETQGVLRRRQGSGTYVNRVPQVLESGLEVLESISTMSKRIGLSVDYGSLSIALRAAENEEATALNVPPGSEVLSILRVVLAGGHPVAYLVDVLPPDVLRQEDLKDDFKGSILDLLLQLGVQPVASRTEINAVSASPRVARALGIQRGDVLLNFVANVYVASGRVIDHSHSYFLPGYFRFHVVRRIDPSVLP